MRASGSAWCYASEDERAWWGRLWADRLIQSGFAGHATRLGLAGQADLDRLARAWRRWAASPDGCFLIPHAEILGQP